MYFAQRSGLIAAKSTVPFASGRFLIPAAIDITAREHYLTGDPVTPITSVSIKLLRFGIFARIMPAAVGRRNTVPGRETRQRFECGTRSTFPFLYVMLRNVSVDIPSVRAVPISSALHHGGGGDCEVCRGDLSPCICVHYI